MAADFAELVEAANELRFRRDGMRLQAERWRTAEHDLVDDDLAAFEAELFAVTLHRLRRAAEHALSVTGSDLSRAAITAFENAVPHMEDIRDVLTHFDAYLKGEGTQRAATGSIGRLRTVRVPPLSPCAARHLTLSEAAGMLCRNDVSG